MNSVSNIGDLGCCGDDYQLQRWELGSTWFQWRNISEKQREAPPFQTQIEYVDLELEPLTSSMSLKMQGAAKIPECFKEQMIRYDNFKNEYTIHGT